MNSIGIDIGSYSVKVAVLTSSGKIARIRSLEEYPLSQDPNKDRTIELVEIFRAIREKHSESDSVTVTATQQDRVALRRKTFPFRERHKILKSLPFELEDDIPFSAENSVFDFKTTHFVGNTAHVIACACPKEYLRQFLTRLEESQLYPDVVSVEGIALANAFEEDRESPTEYSAKEQALPDSAPAEVVFHIGHHSTLVLVLKDGYLLDIRQVDWGGRDIAETIASKYSMAYTEALKELKRKAFILTNNEGATREQIALSEVIKSSVDKLAHHLQLILLEIKNAHNLVFRTSQVSGGVSLMRNLGPYLTQKLEMPVNRLSHIAFAPDLNLAGSPNNEVAFLTAIGLGLEGLKRPKNPAINFLKAEFARQSEALRLMWERWRTAALTVGAAFLILFSWGMLREGYALDMAGAASDKLRDLARKVLNERRVPEPMIRAYIREQEQKARMKTLFENLNQINSPLDILKKVTQVSPNRSEGPLVIKQVSIENEVVRISGETSRVELLSRLQNALRGLARDGQVQAQQAAPASKPGYRSFSYTLRVDRKASL